MSKRLLISVHSPYCTVLQDRLLIFIRTDCSINSFRTASKTYKGSSNLETNTLKTLTPNKPLSSKSQTQLHTSKSYHKASLWSKQLTKQSSFLLISSINLKQKSLTYSQSTISNMNKSKKPSKITTST